MSTIIYLLIALFLLLLNAFFVLAEFAIVKVRSTRLEELARKGHRQAKLAQYTVKHLDGYLSAIQLGITMASLGLGWVGEPALAHLITPLFSLFHIPLSPTVSYTISITIAFIIITWLHVVIGELAPKNLAIRMPEKFALLVSIPLHMFYRLTYIPMWILNESANLFLRLIGFRSSEGELAHSEEEMRMILGHSQEQGRLSLGRLMMFENLFDFGHTIVKEIMIPRGNIAFISRSRSWTETLDMIQQRKRSRYPLCETGPDDITGLIHYKDISLENLVGEKKPDLDAIRRNIHSILEETPVEKLLREFQENHLQMAIVKNYDGKVTGLVTIEDILEELVGEIRDEFDAAPVTVLSSVLVPEAMELDLGYTNRFGAIRMMLLKLHSVKPGFSREEAWKLICKRERGLSSAVGHQAAFPHARLSSLDKPMVIFGRCREGILFPSPDRLPVKLIFLILTPSREHTIQLRILAQLAGLVQNSTLRKKLLSAKDPNAVMDIINVFQNKITQ